MMAKIIREKYEAGILVSREVENGVSYLEIAKLFIHLVIAISVAVIALLNVRDGLSYSDLVDQAGTSGSSCPSPRIQS